ncbi:MAG: ATP-dependent helicase [Patescibacteria group bacterium]|nr:ATP-dependent helicase [Patescibacteria group bacterium]
MSNLLENLNKEQTEAVTHTKGPLLIVAGAGTGKTTVITRKIAYLIEQGLAKPDEILALTFTEKAAGEMRERADILLPLGYYDMWISTFHSFCQRILDQHGLDIGLPGDFKILTETQQWILIHNNLDKFNLDYYRPLGNPKKFISALLKHFSKCKDELITPAEYLEYAQSLRLRTDMPEKTKRIALSAKKKNKVNRDQQTAVLIPSPLTLNPDIDETEIARLEEVANAYHVYQKLLLDNNSLDFADLINYTLELFKKRPKILSHYQNKFKYILVDEFQDTNYAQYQLVKLLTMVSAQSMSSRVQPKRSLSGEKIALSDALLAMTPPSHFNLTVVGDDDQSIYKFRGASVSNILKFQEDFPDLKQTTLVENYRSSQEILDLAYNFIQLNNPDRLEVKLKIDKRLKSRNSPEKPNFSSFLDNHHSESAVQVLEGKDLSDELNGVAKKILELKSQNPKQSWNDFAILIRSNSASDELLPILSSYGIPHTFVSSTGLYKKPLIANLIAYMKLLGNFHDSLSLYRVLTFADFGIKPKDLSTLMELSVKKTLSLYEVLQQAQALPEADAETKSKITEFLEILHCHARESQAKAATEVFVDIIDGLKLRSKLEASSLENAENRELLEQFYKKMESFVQENADKSLHYFLHLLDLELEAGDEGQIKFDPNLGPENLKVLTVHAAKGLEFAYVFIVNLVDQRFPTRARKDQIEIPSALVKDILPEGDFHLQEERRLFYVSLTRAKQKLFLTWAKDYGGKTLKKPSQFLLETHLVPGEKVSAATGKVIFTKVEQRPAVYRDLPKNFSFSAIKSFKNCPLEYKYKYFLKFPAKGNHYLSFGQTIHATFELFLKDFQNRLNSKQRDLFGGDSGRIETGSFELLEELYRKNWVDEWYLNKEDKEKYRKRGLDMLKIFYADTKINPPAPKYIEQRFSLKLGDYSFNGKIDRADLLPSGGLKILDYKTSEKVPKKAAKDDLDQLYIYQWAAQEFLNEKVSELSYWYLNENKIVPEEIAPEEKIAKLKNSLFETIELINYTIEHDLFRQEHAKLRDHKCQYEGLE